MLPACSLYLSLGSQSQSSEIGPLANIPRAHSLASLSQFSADKFIFHLARSLACYSSPRVYTRAKKRLICDESSACTAGRRRRECQMRIACLGCKLAPAPAFPNFRRRCKMQKGNNCTAAGRIVLRTLAHPQRSPPAPGSALSCVRERRMGNGIGL